MPGLEEGTGQGGRPRGEASLVPVLLAADATAGERGQRVGGLVQRVALMSRHVLERQPAALAHELGKLDQGRHARGPANPGAGTEAVTGRHGGHPPGAPLSEIPDRSLAVDQQDHLVSVVEVDERHMDGAELVHCCCRRAGGIKRGAEQATGKSPAAVGRSVTPPGAALLETGVRRDQAWAAGHTCHNAAAQPRLRDPGGRRPGRLPGPAGPRPLSSREQLRLGEHLPGCGLISCIRGIEGERERFGHVQPGAECQSAKRRSATAHRRGQQVQRPVELLHAQAGHKSPG
jgi:hypothetical protein